MYEPPELLSYYVVGLSATEVAPLRTIDGSTILQKHFWNYSNWDRDPWDHMQNLLHS